MNSSHAEQLDVVSIISRTLAKLAIASGTTANVTISTSTTLGELAGVAANASVGIDRLFSQAALESFATKRGLSRRTARNALEFIRADRRHSSDLVFTNDSEVTWSLDTKLVEQAARKANLAIELIDDLASGNDVPIFAFLGLRNLSSFVGEVFASEVFRVLNDKLRPNPNQDGYPDLMACTEKGRAYIEEREQKGETSVKSFWSPYPFGGIEVKATCGDVDAASVRPKPRVGESRIATLQNATWKAHHRDTNNLLAIFWDFLDGIPTVLAVFYRNDLSSNDWGKLIQPKIGGGRTTSVSIMTRTAVKRMGQGWLLLPRDQQTRATLCQRRIFDINDETIRLVCPETI